MRSTGNKSARRAWYRRPQRGLMAAAAAALLALPVAGTLLPATSAQAADDTQAVQKGGTLDIILNPEPPILILGLNQQAPTQLVGGKIYEGLLRYDHDLNPLPGLAKSWEISEDGLTYTFHLREDATWHDGEPFTAHDVVFTAKTFTPETNPRWRLIFSHVDTVEAPDDNTVVFNLKEPFPAFIIGLGVTNMPIMPAHIYEGTEYRSNEMNDTPIGTGPFKFVKWEKGSYVHLTAYEDYWQEGRPYLDEIYFRIIPDAASRALAMETGQVDISQFGNIEPFDVPRLAKMPNLELTTKGYEMFAPMAWIEINHRKEPLDDRRFRQAIMYALDREFIRDNIFFGLGRIATGPINSVTTHYTPDVQRYPHDPEKARALLDEMGLKPGSDGVRAKVEFLIMPYGEVWTRLAEYIKQAMDKVGVQVTLRSTDSAGWAQQVANWNYQMTNDYVYQYGHPALGVARTYISDNIRKGVLFSNTMGYSNPRVDELFAKAAVENDDAKREQMYAEVQKILAKDVPVAWLLEMEFPTLLNKRVHNAVTTAIGTSDNFADVWVEPKQ